MNGCEPPPDGRALERAAELFQARLRPEGVDPLAQRRAVIAFREARRRTAAEFGTRRAPRTRRRDDWRPGVRFWRRGGRRAAVAGLVASLALGSAAYAAYVALPAHGGPHRPTAPHPSATPSAGLDGHSSRRGSGPVTGVPGTRGPHGAPSSAASGPGAADPAHCRVHPNTPGAAHQWDVSAYRNPVKAAGGETRLPDHCAAPAAGGHPGDDEHRRGKGTKGRADGRGTGRGSKSRADAGAGSGTGAGAESGPGSEAGSGSGSRSGSGSGSRSGSGSGSGKVPGRDSGSGAGSGPGSGNGSGRSAGSRGSAVAGSRGDSEWGK